MKYFPALTGLRAIAAYLVFFHHFNFLQKIMTGSVLSRMVDEFYIGVSIFFVLSGFLIYYRYSDQNKDGKFSWSDYIRNRIARIYPMYFLLTTITFIVIFIFKTTNFSDKENLLLYFLNITFLKGFFDSFKFNGIIQGWTLTVEECFYFLAPIVMFRPVRQWFIFLWGFIIAGMLLTFIGGTMNLYGLFGSFQFTFVFTIFGRILEFLAGMCLAHYLKGNTDCGKGYKFTLLGISSIILFTYLLAFVKARYNVQQGIYHPIGIIINNLFLPVGVVFLIYGLVKELNCLSRILSARFTQLLGKSSYCFYLIHMGVIYDLIILVYPHDLYFIPFIILNLISIILYRYVENPLNRVIRNISSKPKLSTARINGQ